MPDPAPGPLHLVQSLADTLRDDPPTDLLSTREEGAAWLRAAGLLAADAGLSNSEYAALVRLRDGSGTCSRPTPTAVRTPRPRPG